MKIENDYSNYFIVIEELNIKDLRSILNISKDMAYKYKRGKNIPPLKKAVKLEDEFNIPLRTWIHFTDHKAKESNNA